MARNEQQQERPKGERRFSQEQYDMLLRCSEKKDISEWNQWREDNPREEILLESADLAGAYMRGANLRDALLQGALLEEADLQGADLERASLDHAELRRASLRGAIVVGTSFKRAKLCSADLSRARLDNANLAGAALLQASLARARLVMADLGGADLHGADLRGAQLSIANLSGVKCPAADLNGSTLLWKCRVDRKTDFRGTALGAVQRIDPSTRQLLEYNARRLSWEDWYGEHLLRKRLVRPFWRISNYGLSTVRIIAVFFLLAVLFAAVYWIWGLVAPPGIIRDLFADAHGPLPPHHVPLRALYFSIAAMTSLGLGDISVARSIWAYVLLTIQFLLGYVLLAALVTRFAILFTAGGPAGEFAKPEKPKSKKGGR